MALLFWLAVFAGGVLLFALYVTRHTFAAWARGVYDAVVWTPRTCPLCLCEYVAPRSWRGTRFKRVTGGEVDSETKEVTPVTGVVDESLCPRCTKEYDAQMFDFLHGGDNEQG